MILVRLFGTLATQVNMKIVLALLILLVSAPADAGWLKDAHILGAGKAVGKAVAKVAKKVYKAVV